MKLSYINFSIFILLSFTILGYGLSNSSEADNEKIVLEPKKVFNYTQKIDKCLNVIKEDKGEDYTLNDLEINTEIYGVDKIDVTLFDFNLRFNGSEEVEQICTQFIGFGINMTSECTIIDCPWGDYDSDEDESMVVELEGDESEEGESEGQESEEGELEGQESEQKQEEGELEDDEQEEKELEEKR
uniref:Cystatin domain-containing protein n=1 Tax=Strongyloides papillosus TaxID=174720 RepID=A0A0N5B6Q3_STREA